MFRIFVASKALEFAGMPLPQFQKDFLLRQQHVSQLYNWRALFPSMEQWIIESDGEPVGRLIFSNLPDQIIACMTSRCCPAVSASAAARSSSRT